MFAVPHGFYVDRALFAFDFGIAAALRQEVGALEIDMCTLAFVPVIDCACGPRNNGNAVKRGVLSGISLCQREQRA